MIVRVDAYPAPPARELAEGASCAEAAAGAPPPYDAVSKEFPGVTVRFMRRSLERDRSPRPQGIPPTRRRTIELGREQWRAPAPDFWAFDEEVDRIASRREATLVLAGSPGWEASEIAAVLTRCQRWVRRRNRASSTPFFRRVLRRFRAMFDFDQPLALADYRHALDTWQWTLRLDAEASLPLQLAALLHDVERLASETEHRIEQHAPDYGAFKNAHALEGSAMTHDFLIQQGAGRALAERTSELVRRHEQPGDDADLLLLNDADGLSFFSLNSAGYFDYFGPEATRRKIRYTLSRMRRESTERLSSLWLRRDVEAMLAEELRP
jgi:hypothetical protein